MDADVIFSFNVYWLCSYLQAPKSVKIEYAFRIYGMQIYFYDLCFNLGLSGESKLPSFERPLLARYHANGPMVMTLKWWGSTRYRTLLA